MRSFVLASASPARLGLLRRVGIEPEVIVSGVDEDGVEGTPEDVVLVLARRKAMAVAASVDRGALVLGCDSMLEIDGRALGKPASAADAVERWRSMRGRTGVLRTGHCLVEVGGRTVDASAATTVRFADVTDAEIEAYVGTGEPLHVAGAFTIDGFGAALVDGIDGSPSNVIGCCLPTLRRLLHALGTPVTSWWP